MISKSIEGSVVEWDKQLPLLLFAYRSTVQDSAKESPFFILYGRDPRLPTASDMALPHPTYAVDLDDYNIGLTTSLANVQKCAMKQNCLRKSRSCFMTASPRTLSRFTMLGTV